MTVRLYILVAPFSKSLSNTSDMVSQYISCSFIICLSIIYWHFYYIDTYLRPAIIFTPMSSVLFQKGHYHFFTTLALWLARLAFQNNFYRDFPLNLTFIFNGAKWTKPDYLQSAGSIYTHSMPSICNQSNTFWFGSKCC